MEGAPFAGARSEAAPYFEKQDDAWCGMHALNNYLGGPYVDKADPVSEGRTLKKVITTNTEGRH
jgi:hypothetical protein